MCTHSTLTPLQSDFCNIHLFLFLLKSVGFLASLTPSSLINCFSNNLVVTLQLPTRKEICQEDSPLLENLPCPGVAHFIQTAWFSFCHYQAINWVNFCQNWASNFLPRRPYAFFVILCNIFQVLIECNIINSKIHNCHLKKTNTKNPNQTKIKPSTFSTLPSANRSLHLVHSDYLPQASKTSAWYAIIILCFKNHQWGMHP